MITCSDVQGLSDDDYCRHNSELIHEKRVKCAVYVSLIPFPVVCKLIQVADQTDF